MEKEFQKDMTPLDKGQMNAVKYIVTISQQFADRVERIMKQYGMWEKGFRLHVGLCPDLPYYTGAVSVSRTVKDGVGEFEESVQTSRGYSVNDNIWQLTEFSTTREFIHLFDEKKDGDGTEEIPFAEKPLPSDNLWIGSADNDPDVDSREWDVNDSLS